MSYDAVIFDSDGVLVRPTDRRHIEQAVRDTFATFEILDPPDEHVDAFARGRSIDRLRAVAAEHDLDLDTFWRHREETSSRGQRALIESGDKAVYEDVDALPAIAAAYPLGVVSNNQQATVDFVLEHGELAAHFGAVYGRPPTIAGFRRMKPDPHFLDRAIEDIGASAAVYVGDSETDIAAARRAGVDVIYLKRSHNYDAEMEPTHTVESLRELCGILECTPT